MNETFDYKNLPALASYIDRIGAEQLNFRRFMIKENKGSYYIERALVKIKDDGSIVCSNAEYDPTPEEIKDISSEISKSKFPKYIEATNVTLLDRSIATGELFVFLNRKTNNIIMVQERKIVNGEKVFCPWTMWSDGNWRRMEPEGKLPFWKPSTSTHSRLMIHEGAKSAAYVEKLCMNGGVLEDGSIHPWYYYLQQFEHWGMIGGALAPHRTDYKELHEHTPGEVIYVCDNDPPGKNALKHVSKNYGKAMKGVMFDDRFKPSWDLAEDIPPEFFKLGRYIGPLFEAFVSFATRATTMVEVEGSKKQVATLNREFEQEWTHCVSPEIFVHKDYPDRMLTLDEFNNAVRPFSDVKNTANLLQSDASSKGMSLRYSPALPSGLYGSIEDGRCINTYTPSIIKPLKGDATPWEEFLEHLVPFAGDRHELCSWVSTLVARPDIKMHYGVLLISENQGVGKGTLGEKILTPLVGASNVSSPSEQTIVDSNYNYWVAHKRLAVIHEIYSGHSSKAYNKLKSYITEQIITVSRKYQAEYNIENWLHVLACSNSKRAIRLSEDDRRWFLPRITEKKKPEAYWIKFNDWLKEENGLQIIRWWCEEFVRINGAVSIGSDAPSSSMKREMIAENYSAGQTVVAQTLDMLRMKIDAGELPKDFFTTDKDLVELIKVRLYEGRQSDKLERPMTIRRLAKERGWLVSDQRAQVQGWGTNRLESYIITLDQATADASPGSLYNPKMDPKDRRTPTPAFELIPL